MLSEICDLLQEQDLVSVGDRVLVALSGGPDSVALLHLLVGASRRLNLELHAAHLDHALRDESREDARFVAGLCSSLGIPLVVERRDVASLARLHRQGFEEAARDQRRRFLLDTARKLGCAAIALGHHRGDQAETVLHRLLRGAGPAGLAAMRPRNGLFIRPLLSFSRKQIVTFLAEQGHAFVEDASNRERRFTRNRIRMDLLPLLREFNPRVEEHLAGLARRLAEDEDFWNVEAAGALAGLRQAGDREVWLDRPRLLALHPALRSRVLRMALGEVRGHLDGLAAVHFLALENLLRNGPVQGEIHLPSAWAARRYQRLWLRAAPPDESPPFVQVVDGPATVLLPDGRRLLFGLTERPRGEHSGAVEFAARQAAFPLTVRTFRPGDRFHPLGAPGGKKLKDFFIDQKVEREARASLPLVDAGEILWVVGMRRCAGYGLKPGEEPVLRIELLSAPNPDKALVKTEGL
jgi:tRNA(Ile)-lysidine synthase